MPDDNDTSEEEFDDEEQDDESGSDESNDDKDEEEEEGEPLDPRVQELIDSALKSAGGAQQRNLQKLTGTVGRLQSIMDKQAADPPKNAEVVERMQEQYGEVSELLGLLVDGMDETTLSPAIRQRVTDARDTARRRAENDELFDRVVKAVRPERADPPETEAAQSALREFQGRMESLITKAGMDPDDEVFDWSGAASQALRDGGVAGGEEYFLTQIAAGLKEQTSTERRGKRKGNAGKGSPKGGSRGAKNPLTEGTLDERVEELRRRGAL